MLLWGAEGNGTGWLVLRGAQCGAFGPGQRGTAAWDSLWHPEGRQAACWAAPGLTLLALQAMWDFPHTTCAIPADYLLDLIPRIRPRAFSIASSMLVRAQPFWPRFRL